MLGRTAFFFVGGLALAQTSIVLRAPSRGGFCWSDMLRAKWGEMYHDGRVLDSPSS